MIFINPNTPTMNIDTSSYSLWSFAHDGTAGIIPAHFLVVKNVGSNGATIKKSGGTYGITLVPGEIFSTRVPAGDDLFASAVTGTTDLEVIALVE